MSDISQTTPRNAVFSRLGAGVLASLGTFARARSAKMEYDNLMMLSDSALAARGLSRDAIARYVGAKHLDL